MINGFDRFLDYYESPNFGEKYFINAAKLNYNTNASGFMLNLMTVFPAVSDGTSLSMMTHSWVDAQGWSPKLNALEHNVGMFLMSSKWSPKTAGQIGLGNEVRGLIINDRQSGNMKEAISGSPANHGGSTAFEWSDIRANSRGIMWFQMYRADKNHNRKMSNEEWMIFKLNIGGLDE